jgi:hypothetical protein
MANTVFGIASSEAQAANILNQLQAAGFAREDVSVLMSDKQGTTDFAVQHHTKAPEGAAAGATTGGLLGGAVGWLAGIGSIAIPGVGPFIAAGPIMAALGGAAVGATVGGLTGALIGLGIPEYEAKRYETRLKEGKVLVSVVVRDSEEKDLTKRILEQAGAEDISVGDTAKAEKEEEVRRR